MSFSVAQVHALEHVVEGDSLQALNPSCCWKALLNDRGCTQPDVNKLFAVDAAWKACPPPCFSYQNTSSTRSAVTSCASPVVNMTCKFYVLRVVNYFTTPDLVANLTCPFSLWKAVVQALGLCNKDHLNQLSLPSLMELRLAWGGIE